MRVMCYTFFWLAFSSTSAVAQDILPKAVRSAADRISESQIARDVQYLASDELRGRDTFTPGHEKAARYIVDRLRRARLKPIGDSGTYRQNYVAVQASIDTAAAFIELADRKFRFGDILPFGVTGPVDTTASTVFVGHGARSLSKGIDAYSGIDVRGKFVIAQLALPPGITPDRIPADFEGVRVAAHKLGARAVLLIPTQQQLSQWDDIRRNQGVRSFVRLEPAVPDPSPPRVTSVLLRPDLARALLGADFAEQVFSRQVDATFPPSKPLAATLRVSLPITETKRASHNLVAMIEGSDPILRNEFVTVSAHLDGLVEGPTIAGDSIYNAADDNASGSAGILAIAERMMQAPRPRRSIVFLWDSGEERGLLGSQVFAASTIIPSKQIAAHFNVDMIGSSAAPDDTVAKRLGTAQAREVLVTGPRVFSTELDSIIERGNRAYLTLRLNHRDDIADSPLVYPRTDAKPFIERGIPTAEFWTGFHARYHRPNDEAQYLDFGKIRDVSRTLMAAVWLVANASKRPAPNPFPSRIPRLP